MSEATTETTTQATPEVVADVKAPTEVAAASTTAAPGQTEAKPETATETQVKPPVVPEKYDLKLPEGSTLNQAAIERVASYAKEKGLTQEQAQSVLEREHVAVDAYTKSIDEQFKATQEQWKQSTLADKEIGGQAFKENAEIAHRVINRFASPELVKMLDATGFGNHPEVVRTFVRLGKAMSEDKLILPGAQAGGKKSIEERLYGSTTKQE